MGGAERAHADESALVGANIASARMARGWTQAEMANRCGMSMNVLTNVEGGRVIDGKRTRHITLDELILIAKGLGVPPGELMPALAGRPVTGVTRTRVERLSEEGLALTERLLAILGELRAAPSGGG